MIKMERFQLALSLLLLFFLFQGSQAWSASCTDPFFKSCYGAVHKCPAGCPKACQVDCKFCKPICACDKPGAVCQDPRFIGGDGIMFYFHGRRDEDFCLVSDKSLHINAHFIGKNRAGSTRGFTWVQALGIMFGDHTLYIGADKAADWDDTVDHVGVALDSRAVAVPPGQGSTVDFPSSGVRLTRTAVTNALSVDVEGIFRVVVRVVPITEEESRVHKYDITPDNCFAHLEVNFKFYGLTNDVHGVLGQTYASGFRSRVKIGVAMPIMGGEKTYSVPSLFSTECEVGRFEAALSGAGLRGLVIGKTERLPSVKCNGSGFGGSMGMVCKR